MSTRNTELLSPALSASTREKLDRFAKEFGLDQNFVLEQAVLFFIDSAARIAATALQSKPAESDGGLPREALIPTRLVLDEDTFERVVARIEAQPAPTEALRELMRGGND